MKASLRTGLSFGLTSAVITTLGLIVGLHSGTGSKIAVIGGVLTIAIADAFSDALGIHISKESDPKTTKKEVWESTFFTFLFKFIFALTFIVPLVIFELETAIWASIVWGECLLGLLSYKIAKLQNTNKIHVIAEHFFVSLIVIVATHLTGEAIANLG